MDPQTLLNKIETALPKPLGYLYQVETYCPDCMADMLEDIVAHVADMIKSMDDPMVSDPDTLPQPIHSTGSNISIHCCMCGEHLHSKPSETTTHLTQEDHNTNTEYLLKHVSDKLEKVAEHASDLGNRLKNAELCDISTTLFDLSDLLWMHYVDTNKPANRTGQVRDNVATKTNIEEIQAELRTALDYLDGLSDVLENTINSLRTLCEVVRHNLQGDHHDT